MINFESHTFKRMQLTTSLKGSLNKSLNTFSDLKNSKDKIPGKGVILKADWRLFRNMVLVATSRNLDFKEVLKHFWALSYCNGTLKITSPL